eukprot:8147954-Alexandrium_andersonii.AAC.1
MCPVRRCAGGRGRREGQHAACRPSSTLSRVEESCIFLGGLRPRPAREAPPARPPARLISRYRSCANNGAERSPRELLGHLLR